jgi:hypothetical protein
MCRKALEKHVMLKSSHSERMEKKLAQQSEQLQQQSSLIQVHVTARGKHMYGKCVVTRGTRGKYAANVIKGIDQ